MVNLSRFAVRRPPTDELGTLTTGHISFSKHVSGGYGGILNPGSLLGELDIFGIRGMPGSRID